MTTDFSRYLTAYLLHFLSGQLGASPNTVMSYRDAFMLFLRYCQTEKNFRPDRLTLSMLSRDTVFDFLKWLESKRKCAISTRNQRLAAIHAFFRYLHVEAPEYSLLCQQVLSIPFKRKEQPSIPFLSLEQTRFLLAQPDLETPSGCRDAALLSLLYDSGARVQEIADTVVGDLRLSHPACIRLTGKGQKMRTVPLMSDTSTLTQAYMRKVQIQTIPEHPLFFNRYARKLSRAGISYILSKYLLLARKHCNVELPTTISPHCLRHSKAMHLLQAGVPLIYIRDILGHSDMKTTEIYARADVEMKRAAIEAVSPSLVPSSLPSWKEDDSLMSWLRNLCHP